MTGLSVVQHQGFPVVGWSVAQTLPQSTVAGNAGVILIVCGNVHPATGIQDNASGGSNTWVAYQDIYDSTSTFRLQIWTTNSTSTKAYTTINTVQTGSELLAIGFWEVANPVSWTAPVDVAASAGGTTSTSVSSGSSGTPANGGDLALGLCGWIRSPGASTPDTGYSFTQGVPTAHDVGYVDGSPPIFSVSANYLILTSAAAQTFTTTLPSGPTNTGAIVCLIKGAQSTTINPGFGSATGTAYNGTGTGVGNPCGKQLIIAQSVRRASYY